MILSLIILITLFLIRLLRVALPVLIVLIRWKLLISLLIAFTSFHRSNLYGTQQANRDPAGISRGAERIFVEIGGGGD